MDKAQGAGKVGRPSSAPCLDWRGGAAPVLFRKIAEDALVYSDEHKRSAGDDHIRMEKLLDWFGDRAADSITPREIETHFRAEKWEAGTWNRYRALLSLTYRLAIRAGRAKENPARLVQHKTENNGRVRFLSREEEMNLRKAIRDKFPEHEPELDLAISAAAWRGWQMGHEIGTVLWVADRNPSWVVHVLPSFLGEWRFASLQVQLSGSGCSGKAALFRSSFMTTPYVTPEVLR